MTEALPTPEISKLRARLDLSIRIILGLTFAFSAGLCIKKGLGNLQDIDLAHIHSYEIGHILSVFAIGIYTLMIGCIYFLRSRPVSKFAGPIPCVAILVGFATTGLLYYLPRNDLPLWVCIVASVLVVVGNILTVVIITRLGRSFSFLPEGRRLVTNGPYAIVRHPLYLAEAVATLGVVINFLSVWALLLLVLQLLSQMVRIHYEEKVLKETFPEYDSYAEKTWRLIPGIY